MSNVEPKPPHAPLAPKPAWHEAWPPVPPELPHATAWLQFVGQRLQRSGRLHLAAETILEVATFLQEAQQTPAEAWWAASELDDRLFAKTLRDARGGG